MPETDIQILLMGCSFHLFIFSFLFSIIDKDIFKEMLPDRFFKSQSSELKNYPPKQTSHEGMKHLRKDLLQALVLNPCFSPHPLTQLHNISQLTPALASSRLQGSQSRS